MTKHPIEVITSVERRRRWSQEEKERLVAACFDPDAVISEIARAAGVHVSQLFRWRKELCQVEEPRTEGTSTLVPVIVSEAAPTVQPIPPEPPTTSHPRRKRSDVTIELGRGRRIRVDSDIDTEALGRILDCVLGRR
ncbi:MAG: transposase [Rhizobium sp. 63-7]|nr:MAG: transposase [Rhizobium sp. 63-7]